MKQQSAKEGRELDQGLFLGQILADERCGMHLIHAMLRPKREALERIAEFRQSGFADLGEAKAERKGKVGYVTLRNTKFLNAEDDRATAALEIALDLVLLDDAIEVGVLRGGTVQHPKYKDRRIFNAGINLTHLYYGQISFAHFFVERELGLLHKIYRGHWRSDSYDEQYEDYVEKPWIAAVEAFAIGGGCQLLCVMDRVLAETGSYFNLAGQQGRLHSGRGQFALPAAGRQQAGARRHFLRARVPRRHAGRPHDLRRGRSGGRDGCGDRSQRGATRARRHDERRQQPQGVARRRRAAAGLPPLHGDLCAAAEPVSL